MTFGDAVDAIVRMAAGGSRAFGADRQVSGGGLGRWRGGFLPLILPGLGDPSSWPIGTCQNTANRAGTNFTQRFDINIPATQRYATLTTVNLVRDFGGNEPQFRSGYG